MEQHGGITKTKNQNGLEHAFFSPLCVDLYSNLFSNFQSTKSYFILMPQTRGGDRMREHKNSIPLYPSSQKKTTSKQASRAACGERGNYWFGVTWFHIQWDAINSFPLTHSLTYSLEPSSWEIDVRAAWSYTQNTTSRTIDRHRAIRFFFFSSSWYIKLVLLIIFSSFLILLKYFFFRWCWFQRGARSVIFLLLVTLNFFSPSTHHRERGRKSI